MKNWVDKVIQAIFNAMAMSIAGWMFYFGVVYRTDMFNTFMTTMTIFVFLLSIAFPIRSLVIEHDKRKLNEMIEKDKLTRNK